MLFPLVVPKVEYFKNSKIWYSTLSRIVINYYIK